MRKLRSALTYANVLSTLAVFLVLGSGAYAATQLPKNSVGAKQLKKEAVTPAKLSAAAKTSMTGPQGPQGAAGAKGDRGEKGEKGERGEPGTANVIYSNWSSATSGSAEVYDGTWGQTATISAPSLTAEMINKGSISIYITFGLETLQLPYRSDAGGTFNTIGYTLAPGKITIRRSTDGCNEESCLIGLSPILQYRYVIIPGGVLAG